MYGKLSSLSRILYVMLPRPEIHIPVTFQTSGQNIVQGTTHFFEKYSCVPAQFLGPQMLCSRAFSKRVTQIIWYANTTFPTAP